LISAAASKLHRSIAVIAIIPFLTSCHPPRSELAARMKERSSVSQAAPAARQMALAYQKTNYLLYLPEAYGREQKRWPLILYLHGKSLRGNDLELLKQYGLAALLEKDLAIPFIVVSPQCTPDKMWTERENEVIGLLDDVSVNYSVDRKRIYLTGHTAWEGEGRGFWLTITRKSLRRLCQCLSAAG
jgi:poly(3-hydroxybutyrate) depolymerase